MKLRSDRDRRQGGFTLVEVLVVLVLLGLIMGLVAPRALDYLSRGQARAAALQMDALAASLDLYRLDNGAYPGAREGLEALVRAPAGAVRWAGPYVSGETVPLDPWGNAYRYSVPGTGGAPYGLLSLGADGAQGGSGADADIVLGR